MSQTIYFECGFSCPFTACKHKSKKYDSIEAVNMHISKKHSKKVKLVEYRDPRGRLRLVLRMK